MGVRRIWGVVVLGVMVGEAAAGVVELTNGLPFNTPSGRVRVDTDDYGGFGAGISPNNEDAYQPPGENFIATTWLAGVYLFVRTPDDLKSAILLNDDTKWQRDVEPAAGNNADGILGDHAGMARTITQQNAAMGPNIARSQFTVGDPTANPAIELTIDLTQTLTHDPPTNTSTLLQSYRIANTGDTSLDLIFHGHWDGQLIWDDGFDFNIVGAGPGLCYVFMHDMQGGERSIAFADGGSTVPRTNYYGSKTELVPEGGPPVYATEGDTVFVTFGTPPSWQNRIANVPGQLVAGSSGATPGKDPAMGLEWRFTIAAGATETIALRRIWGTTTLLCPGGASCGDGVVDDGEQCDDGEDTLDCNLLSCTPVVCGDGYVNAMAEQCEPPAPGVDGATCNADCTMAVCGDRHVNAIAGEMCDEGGIDTDTCNANCKPVLCGDGYLNATVEQCEEGELCDLTSCRYDFELGGGCAGCATKRTDGSWIVALLALCWVARRRRYN